MLRKKSLSQEEFLKLTRSKGKSKAKTSLRSIINSKTVKVRNNQSLKNLLNFTSGSASKNNEALSASKRKYSESDTKKRQNQSTNKKR